MNYHRFLHAAILFSTLLGSAGLVLVLLAPLLFEKPPPGLRRWRWAVVGVGALAAALFLLEWAGHRRGLHMMEPATRR